MPEKCGAGKIVLTMFRHPALANEETDMAFDLIAHLTTQARALKAGLIKQACREINACVCPVKRAQAVQMLRLLQKRLKNPAL